jgi:hypothetical protein
MNIPGFKGCIPLGFTAFGLAAPVAQLSIASTPKPMLDYFS